MAQSNTKSILPISIRYGLIVGLISAVFSLLLSLLGFDPTDPNASTTTKLLTFGVSMAIFAWGAHAAITEYKKNVSNSHITYGKCVGISTLMGLASGVVSAIYFFLLSNFIDPGLMDKIKTGVIRQYEENGMSEDQIEQALEFGEFFMSPAFMAISQLLGALFFGTVIGLIVGLFLKNDKATSFKDDILDA